MFENATLVGCRYGTFAVQIPCEPDMGSGRLGAKQLQILILLSTSQATASGEYVSWFEKQQGLEISVSLCLFFFSRRVFRWRHPVRPPRCAHSCYLPFRLPVQVRGAREVDQATEGVGVERVVDHRLGHSTLRHLCPTLQVRVVNTGFPTLLYTNKSALSRPTVGTVPCLAVLQLGNFGRKIHCFPRLTKTSIDVM